MAILSGGAALGGVFGGLLGLRRGPVRIRSDHFFDCVYDGDPGKLIRAIQQDGKLPHGLSPRDPLADELRKLVGKCPPDYPAWDHTKPARSPCEKVVILSGGGQWGAYGAGLFDAMAKADPDALAIRNVRILTGISTGSLQLLLLMVALDPAQTKAMRQFAIERLVWGYSPVRESDIVDNDGMIMAPVKGSQAGTGPLRKRIRETLYAGGDPRLVEAIGKSSIAGFIGFVQARCGLFHYADVRELVTKAPSVEAAVDALTAAAMGSSAMPVFHQQLRVIDGKGEHTLYDGGVRRSVFFANALEEMVAEARGQASLIEAEPTKQREIAAELMPEFFVLRNGPTVRTEEDKLDGDEGPLRNGKRAYDLLVNESEIGAIAQLRLFNRRGRVFLSSADKWTECGFTRSDKMFDPAFMSCLRVLGATNHARSDGGWWPIPIL